MPRKTSDVTAGLKGRIGQYNNLRDEAEASSFFLPYEQASPDLTLAISPGKCFFKKTLVDYAGGNTANFTAPSSDPRIDLLYLTEAGVLTILTGTEAASPTAPSIPENTFPICYVYNRVGQTSVKETDDSTNGYIYQDLRPAMVTPVDQLPFFQQRIYGPVEVNATPRAFGTNEDGSVLYFHHDDAATNELHRYERDSKTGMYFFTHSVSVTTPIEASSHGSIVKIGSYIYLFRGNGGNVIATRYDETDLANETSMTVPSVTITTVGRVSAWSDGVDAYLVASNTSTTVRRWTVSGTTFSAAGTTTATSGIFAQSHSGSFYDGSNTFTVVNDLNNTSKLKVYKTDLDGTNDTLTETSFVANSSDNKSWGAAVAGIDTDKLYIGFVTLGYDNTDEERSLIELYPVTKP